MRSQLKDFNITRQLSSHEKTEINSLLLAMRFKDSISFLNEEKTPKKSSFKAFVKTIILGYGSTHSEKGSGFFIDPYFRLVTEDMPPDTSGIDKNRKSKLCHTAIKAKNENQVLILIDDIIIANKMLTEYVTCQQKLSLRGLKYKALCISKDDEKPIIKILGTSGQFINKTKQLWIAANNGKFEETFSKLFADMNPKVQTEQFKQYINDLTVKESKNSAKIIQAEILEDLESANTVYYPGQASQLFYLKLFMKLIRNIDTSNIQAVRIKETQLSFSRLQKIILIALKDTHSHEAFLFFLEYAFDELIYLVTLSQKYSKKTIKNILVDFIQRNYQLDVTNKEMIPNIYLGHCGMQVITHLIYTAIDEVCGHKNFSSGKLYLQSDAYFELENIINYRLKSGSSKCTQNEICFLFCQGKTIIEPYKKDQLCDILVCAFNENVSRHATYKSMDVINLIENQLKLRLEMGFTKKRLIVIVDTTLNSFDDSKMTFLLMSYEDKIRNGQLSIFTAHSLNKYFHIGFDKLPAGLSAGFYNKKHYPLMERFYKKKWLGHYFKYNTIPKMIAHMIKYAIPEIITYHNIILGNSRFVHDDVIPKQLMNANGFISIYNPYTSDIYKDISGFLVIKFNYSAEMDKIGKLLKFIISRIMPIINIKNRNGFGFNRTNYAAISELCRLNIGTESRQDLKKSLSALFYLCCEINLTIELCAERMGLDYTVKLIDEMVYEFVCPVKIKKDSINNQIIFPDNFESCIDFAKKDHADAQYRVGVYYEEGIEIKRDLKEAFSWFRIASYHDHPEAIYKIANFYEHGFGIEKNIKQAINFYKKSAELGHEKAQYRLGLHYQENQDIVMAGIYFVKAYIGNNPNAFFRISSQTNQKHIEKNYRASTLHISGITKK